MKLDNLLNQNVSCQSRTETDVILSGDPCQLGLIIQSPISLEFGLGVSFLERLMQSEMHDEREQDGNTYVQTL